MSARTWRFGRCEFDEARHELRVDGHLVDVEAKPLEVLRQLLLNAGEVLTKEELIDAAWPGVSVVDGSLATAVSKLRKALNDDGLIVTVSRVGYRLAGPVVTRSAGAPDAWKKLALAPDEGVTGRPEWRLSRRLDVSPAYEVWLAVHATTGERRVFKFATGEEHLRGLKREVTLARLLRASLGQRPEFVPLIAWNFDGPPYFIESQYVGPNLSELAATRGGLALIPLEERLALFLDIASAVELAHSVDVLHKDLKPSNILVSGAIGEHPVVTIADFGCATLLAPTRLDEHGITSQGFTQPDSESPQMGTAIYVAPEMLLGHSPTVQSDVFALGVLLFQFVAGDFRQSLAPGWEQRIADPLLCEDIALAADGDPARRLPSVAALVARLRRLDERRALLAAPPVVPGHGRRRWYNLVAAVVVAALAAATWWFATRADRKQPTPLERQVVAVLPFDNASGDTALDYLRYALADEVAATLGRSTSLTVRPLSSTRLFQTTPTDLQKASETLQAGTIVTGYFSRTGDRLRVVVEANDVVRNRLAWRDQMETPAGSLIATQMQLTLRARAGLVTALGATAVGSTPVPRHEGAYTLYLQALAVPLDPAPNPAGIDLLERSVALDPDYAPAWISLGRRYYVAGRYQTRDDAFYARGIAANARALAIDPSYATAASVEAGTQIESGDLLGAHARLMAILERTPDNADTRFWLSYAYRFAGSLDLAAAECERALVLNATTQNSGLRSCAVVFLLRGDYPGAMNYLALAPGTEFAKAMTLQMYVRQGRHSEAIALGVPDIPQWSSYPLLIACVAGKPAAVIDRLASRVTVSPDPEVNYFAATHMATCGRTARALELLGAAIEGRYCGYPAMDSDPLLQPLRQHPAFGELREKARACHEEFAEGFKRAEG